MSSHKWWTVSVENLEKDFRIVVVDLRGFGQSTYHRPVESLKELAQDIIDLCGQINIKRATFVGWSLGGLVTMKIAEMNSSLAHKIALTCSVGHLGLKFV